MKNTRLKLCLLTAASALAFVWAAPSARANVFATNIKLYGSLTGATNAQGAPVTISYILNEPATLGTTIQILSGATVVNTIGIPSGTAGALRGLNSVVWGGTNSLDAQVPAGIYSVAITPAAIGFTNWTQTSIDTNPGMPANSALGIDVDKNTNSPYYGRVIIGNTTTTASYPGIPAGATNVGFYKMNADGSQADEGWFGYAGYTNDDGGNGPTAGQMPNSGFDPMKIRIGDDDRIYWVDNSYYGAIIACDMLATTNQVVIDEGSYAGALDGPNNYSGNPEIGDLFVGFQEFDVSGTTTTNAAIWLCDQDSPNWGIWMYHLRNGAADPVDTVGTKVVYAGTGGDIALATSGGCMVDNKLDIFVGEDQTGDTSGNAVYIAMVFTNWNKGVLPPEGGGFSYATGALPGEVEWGYGTGVDTVGAGDPTFEGLEDVVINSRVNPTIVACPCSGGNDATPGIRLLNATNGSVIVVTNGSGTVIQTLTNLDWGQAYTCAAWDNVGNLYAASTTRNVWRVWSPPGPNTNTTVAVGQVQVTLILAPSITSITVGGPPVTILFTGPASASASAFALYSSSSVTAPFTVVGNAKITALSPPGNFQAVTTTSGSARFYQVSGPATLIPAPSITSITMSGAPVTILFTGPASASASDFSLYSSGSVTAPFTVVGNAKITALSPPGNFQAVTTTSGSARFYQIYGP